MLTVAVFLLSVAYLRERSRHRRLYWLTRQAVHDLRSPLHVLDAVSKFLPDDYKLLLKSSKCRTQDILEELHHDLVPLEMSSNQLLNLINELITEKAAAFQNIQFTKTLNAHQNKKYLIPISQLKRALENVLQNAVDSKTKSIHLSCEGNDQSLKLKVADQGCGIGSQDLIAILKGQKTKLNGEGLGLKQVRSAIKQMGGQFKIESGRGTQVTLEIPTLTTL